jgi:hypothetical protein
MTCRSGARCNWHTKHNRAQLSPAPARIASRLMWSATTSTALTVHGAGTNTQNAHVTVNGVVGAIIN